MRRSPENEASSGFAATAASLRHALANLATGLDALRDSLGDTEVSREELGVLVGLMARRLETLLHELDRSPLPPHRDSMQ